MKSNHPWRVRAVPALILAVAALGVTACGSGGSGAAKTTAKTTTTASSTGRGRGAFAANRGKLVACLKAHGVTLPARPRNVRPGGLGSGPGSGGSGRGRGPGGGGSFGSARGGGFFGGAGGNSKAAKAFRACAGSGGLGRLPGAGAGRFTPHYSTATLTSFSKCVKKHGFTLPAPNTSGKGPIFPPKIEKNAKFQTAARSCEGILRAAFPRRLPRGAVGSPPAGAGGAPTSTTSAT